MSSRSAAGSAPGLGPGGREFESRRLDHLEYNPWYPQGFFYLYSALQPLAASLMQFSTFSASERLQLQSVQMPFSAHKLSLPVRSCLQEAVEQLKDLRFRCRDCDSLRVVKREYLDKEVLRA